MVKKLKKVIQNLEYFDGYRVFWWRKIDGFDRDWKFLVEKFKLLMQIENFLNKFQNEILILIISKFHKNFNLGIHLAFIQLKSKI